MTGNLLLASLAMIPAIVAIDLLWLGVLMKDFYRSELGHLLSASPNWYAAGAFYVVFSLALTYFALRPGLATGSLWAAVVPAVFFGLAAYATYDLTNMATLRQWPLSVTLVDIVWGGVLSGVVASVGYLVATRAL